VVVFVFVFVFVFVIGVGFVVMVVVVSVAAAAIGTSVLVIFLTKRGMLVLSLVEESGELSVVVLEAVEAVVASVEDEDIETDLGCNDNVNEGGGGDDDGDDDGNDSCDEQRI
jgi:hypothetical protein